MPRTEWSRNRFAPVSGSPSKLIDLASGYFVFASLVAGICLLFRAEHAAAQAADRAWTVSVAAGLAVQNERQDGHLALLATHAAANISARVTPRLALRVEGLTTRFGEWEDHVHAPCPPDTPPFGCHPPAGPVQLTALTVGIGGGGRRERRYAVIGGGAYYLFAHPTAKGDTRAGFYAAYGSTLVTSRPNIKLEAQLHWVPGLSHGGEWSLPIRLGLAF